jgi:hypothetical protein
MGQIVLSGAELVSLLTANAQMPERVLSIETKGQEIRVHVATPLPVLRSIRVRMRFAGYEQGHVVLQLVTNRLVDQFEWLVNRMLAALKIPDHGSRWEYPRLYVDVNRLLQQQVRGVQIAGVAFQDGRFHITTSHRVDEPAGAPENAAPPGGRTSRP